MRSIIYKIGSNIKIFDFEKPFTDIVNMMHYRSRTINNLRLIINELIDNIINRTVSKDDIELALSLYQDEIKIQLRSHKTSFKQFEIPNPKMHNEYIEENTNGNGMQLIHEFSDFVSYDRFNDENILTIVTHTV